MSSETFLATFGLDGLRLVERHDVAVRRIARVIDAGRCYAVVPWQMALVACAEAVGRGIEVSVKADARVGGRYAGIKSQSLRDGDISIWNEPLSG